ncbi:MarR family transcriptional regulator [Jatrophihabitans telluris]|uniref:MarR family transcriptional regulator n=1 Tax=Jatrophihabitans telluris TaxID=2038343 RepID=A0ABY4QVU3_9ACTN|nr:MarR family transcriptional regulator [Jatrophihabitans telluris]UQX87680.1 MarR family transcriptional regulator [Jatrophihabitans telluris]
MSATELPAEAGEPRRPPIRTSDWRLAVWRSFLRTHTHILRRLEQDLQAHHKIAIASYDVLVQLAEAPGRRLRMSELADAVLLSRSGLTRLVDRLQREGLVERQPDPDDARGLFTVMTEAGRSALRDAAVVHLTGVSELMIDKLDDDELRQLADLMAKLDPVAAATATPSATTDLD